MTTNNNRFPRWKTALLVSWFFVIVGVVVFSDKRILSYFVPPETPLPQHDAELLIYDPQELYNEPLPPITEFPIVSIEKANESLKGDQLVLGVVVNDEARAYPVKMLCGVQREVVNDHLGDEAIAATWCNLGHNGIVYSRHLDDQELIFQASDKFWKNSLLMQDQTESVWSLLMGRCMEGENEGRELKQLPSQLTDYETWRKTYPQSTVMLWPQEFQENFHYDRQYYQRVEKMQINFSVGIVIRRVAKHYPFAALRKQPLINDTHEGKPLVIRFDENTGTFWCYLREVNDEVLEFERSNDSFVDKQTGSSWDLNRGVAIDGNLKGETLEAIPAITSFSTTWSRFHPRSEEWTPRVAMLENADSLSKNKSSISSAD